VGTPILGCESSERLVDKALIMCRSAICSTQSSEQSPTADKNSDGYQVAYWILEWSECTWCSLIIQLITVVSWQVSRSRRGGLMRGGIRLGLRSA